jgi:hypothetical protein
MIINCNKYFYYFPTNYSFIHILIMDNIEPLATARVRSTKKITGPNKMQHSRTLAAITLALLIIAMDGTTMAQACGWSGENDYDDEIIMLEIGADGKPVIDGISMELTPEQQTELGNKLREEKDYKGSLIWYSKAAESGYAEAENNMAGLYEFGLGVPKNIIKAALWYQRAATSGEPHAQHSLGMMYANGNGVALDKAKAMGWLERSAGQKHLKAFADMARIQDNGPENLKWLLLAVHHGDTDAQPILEMAKSGSSEVDMNKANELFNQWLANNK